MRFVLSFDCDSAAFDGDVNDLEAAVVATLRYVTRRVEEHSTLDQVIRDVNGNVIGRFTLTDENDLMVALAIVARGAG